MDFRHIFFPFFSNQKLGRTQGKKTHKRKDLFYMIKVPEVSFLEKKLVIC